MSEEDTQTGLGNTESALLKVNEMRSKLVDKEIDQLFFFLRGRPAKRSSIYSNVYKLKKITEIGVCNASVWFFFGGGSGILGHPYIHLQRAGTCIDGAKMRAFSMQTDDIETPAVPPPIDSAKECVIPYLFFVTKDGCKVGLDTVLKRSDLQTENNAEFLCRHAPRFLTEDEHISVINGENLLLLHNIDCPLED